VAIFITDFLKGYDVLIQNTIMQKVVSHELFVEIVLPYLHDIKMLKHRQQVIENFKFRLNSHVTSQWSNKFTMVKDIFYTFISINKEQ
jgi:predicted 2-oxoglutarate/Fe(II)-dependent dioxygenase YbiX